MPPLRPWMRYLMWIAGGYNLALGVNMVLSPAGAFEAFDLPLPELMLFVELVGLMVAVFGVGYCLVALRPLENRGVLALGLLGKTLVAIWGLGYVLLGKVPVAYLAVVFFSDIIYLLPFALILRHLQRAAAERTN